jgi:fructose-1,6-bisphosphatase I
MAKKTLTLDEFTIQQLRMFPHATGELSSLLRDIGLAAKRIYAEVSKAGLVDIIGAAGYKNVHAEAVQQLDAFAQNQLRSVLRNGLSCAGIASEEMDDIEVFDDVMNNKSKYVVMFDPLDGSSNIDTNTAIGTIFGIYRRKTAIGCPCGPEDFLQPGVNQVAAGYIIYGSSAMMVYATRRGVNGFTLDPSIGEFCLSHPDIHCPSDTPTYSINQGYWCQFEQGVQDFIARCQQRGMSQRYAGSMVADMHRILIKGGIFLYPATHNKPNGKLRLMYECNPFAFIIEVAGGKALNGIERIVELIPAGLHQTCPVYMGSNLLVNELRLCLKKYNLVHA